MSATEEEVSGQCLCKAISFKVKGTPTFTTICHCSNCQKASGAAYAVNAALPVDGLVILKGEDKISTYEDTETASGKPNHKSFCSVCGSNLWTKAPPGVPFIIVPTGVLDDESKKQCQPGMELYAKNRRTWLKAAEGCKQHDGML